MTKEIKLTKGEVALVDDEDFERLSRWKWHCSSGYATRVASDKGKRKFVFMHLEILQAPPGFEVDHINLNRLDDRRENLRIATHSQNMANRRVSRNKIYSQYKGVYRFKRNKSRHWRADIFFDNKQKYLGSFDTEIEAAKAYDWAAKELFGEFARTNFADGLTGFADRHERPIPENGTLRIELFEIVEVGSVAWHRGNWWAVFPTGYPLKLADAAPYCEVL